MRESPRGEKEPAAEAREETCQRRPPTNPSRRLLPVAV